MELSVPQDWNSSFEPQLVEKYDRSFKGFDKKISVLYAMGNSTWDIQEHLVDIYGVKVSAEFISTVTQK